MAYCSTMRRKGVLTHATMWVNLKNIMKEARHRRPYNGMIHFIWNTSAESGNIQNVN